MGPGGGEAAVIASGCRGSGVVRGDRVGGGKGGAVKEGRRRRMKVEEEEELLDRLEEAPELEEEDVVQLFEEDVDVVKGVTATLREHLGL